MLSQRAAAAASGEQESDAEGSDEARERERTGKVSYFRFTVAGGEIWPSSYSTVRTEPEEEQSENSSGCSGDVPTRIKVLLSVCVHVTVGAATPVIFIPPDTLSTV